MRYDSARKTCRLKNGFTLIELLVVLSIIAMLLTVSLPNYFHGIDVAKDTTLVENLRITRETIDKFYGDTGQYPDSLEQLVEKHYLHGLPVDPITDSDKSWILEAPPAGGHGKVYNLHSGAAGNDRLGQAYLDL